MTENGRLLAIARLPCYRDSMIVAFKKGGTEDIFDGKSFLWTDAGPDQVEIVDYH